MTPHQFAAALLLVVTGAQTTVDTHRGVVRRSLASSDVAPTDKPEARDKKIANAAQKIVQELPAAVTMT